VFSVKETHGRAVRPGNRLIAHSPEAGWRSVYALIMDESPFEATENGVPHPSFIYHIGHPTVVTRRIDGAAPESALIGPRRLTLSAGGHATYWAHNGHPQILQVYLRQSLFTDAVSELYGGDPAKAQIVPRFAILDPLLEQLALAIISELQSRDSKDGLYVDTLSQMIAVHLARLHSTNARPARTTAPAIANWKMRRLKEYIQNNLDQDLSLDALAAEVTISPLYLSHAFKAAFGRSPHQYVLERRIERAKELLRNGDLPVAEIALATGFSSQSHLSSWFSRSVGMSPGTYRRPKTC